MSSKRRIRRNACGKKKRHLTAEGATIAARKTTGRGAQPYHCPFCKFYHVGHSKQGVAWVAVGR